MKADVKPGTRCECRDPRCDCSWHYGPVTNPDRCRADAYHPLQLIHRHRESAVARQVFTLALCGGCYRFHINHSEHISEYHERDRKERETASAIHAIHGMPGEPEPDCDDPGAHRPGCKCNGGEPRL